jgi:hopanoid biosynthesis associated RND transporter like protein HpnN
VALLTAAASVWYAYKNLRISTNRNDLVASDQRLIALSDRMDRAFGSRDGLVVVVEAGSPGRAVEFADALALELRRYPEMFPELFYRQDPERFKAWALLYLETPELAALKDKLLPQRRVLASLAAAPHLTGFYQEVNEEITRALIGHLFTGFLDEGKDEGKLPDLGFLNASLQELKRQLQGEGPYVSPFSVFLPKAFSDFSAEKYFFTENDKYLLFLVTPRGDGYAESYEYLKLLRQVVARVKARFPDVQVGVTGPDALQADEMSMALRDVTLATWLSLAGQMLLLILFLRSLKRPFMEGLVLVIGLCWTFGAATLLVGHLNLLSLIFAPLMLGLTIDYGIHWFCRLEEEEADRGRCTVNTPACTFRRAAPGIIYANLAAAVSFVPLIFTGFKGLAELGEILTCGILLMLLATLFLVPALVIIGEKVRDLPAADPGEDECKGHPSSFLHLRWRHPGLVVALGAGLLVLGGFSLYHVPFDLNPLHLQNQKTESVVWEYRLLHESKYSTSYGATATASLPELEARIQALKKLPTVSHVESILSFMPTEVAAKERLLAELRPAFGDLDFPAVPAAFSTPQELAAVLGRIDFKVAQAQEEDKGMSTVTRGELKVAHRLLREIIPLLNVARHPQAAGRLTDFDRKFFADLKDKWDLIRANLGSPPPRLQDLPQAVRQRFIGPEETYLIRVFPSRDIWNFGPLHDFVTALWSIDPNAVGDPVLLYVFTLGFRNACLWAAGMALLAITAMLLLLFRSLKMTFLALLPLFVGTALTLSLMWLLGLSFNQANVLFLPLILGEAVEFGIIILVRWQLEESARAITLPTSTAKGVALAALTTTLGFGSLMVSGHRGTFSLGLLATVGSLSVLLASLSVLPAFLRLVRKSYIPRRPAFHPTMGLGWWSHHFHRKVPNEKAALDP